MNKVILCGRMTRDPEVRYTNGDTPKAVAKFGIAVDRRFKNSNGEYEADFFNCTAFGKQAEFAEKYLKKGTKIVLEGRLQNDNYTNRDGQKITATGIVLDNIEFAESKKADDKPAEAEKTEWASVDNMDQEELPFTF